jgi:hypothetical protein
VLYEPRRRLCAGFGAPRLVADRQKEWTMPVLYVASPDLQLRGRPTVAPEQMNDQQIKNDMVMLALADQLEANGMPPQQAAAMRNLPLDHLYPQG